MTLTNYWWLLIWLFAAGAVLTAVFPKQPVLIMGKREYRWSVPAALILVLPYIIWAGFRNDAWGDTGVYRKSFLSLPTSLAQMNEVVSGETKDRGFTVFEMLFKVFISQSDKVFFLVIASIQIICLVYIYRKYSNHYWLSVFLFVASTDYIAWMHNGMRQFLAATILLACFPLILKKKYVLLIFIILIVSTIHMTALLMLPFIFIVQGSAWNKKTILFILAVIAAVVFLDSFTGFLTAAMENSQYSAETSDFLSDDGVNIIRVCFYAVPTVASLIFRKKIQIENNPIINICVNMSIASTGFYVIGYFTSGIYAGRIPIYFSLYNYVLYPWILENCFTKTVQRVLAGGLAAVYCMFFYYQMGIAWQLL